MKSHLPRAAPVAAVIAVLTGGGVAVASIPAPDGTITACLKGKAEYFPDTARSKCQKGWTTVTWSARGPMGARGPRGAQGAQGAQGDVGPPGADGVDGADGAPGAAADFDAIQVIRNSITVPSGVNSWAVSAACPSGLRVVGGGGESQSSNVFMGKSGPSAPVVGSSVSGWTVFFETENNAPTASPFAAIAWATCVPD